MGLRRITLGLILCCLLIINFVSADVKSAGFKDPNTGYLYKLTSHNVNLTNYQSLIKVYRVKLVNERPAGQFEEIQTIKFKSALVDYDLHCMPTHCYFVAVTSRSDRNVELYSWQRVKFDLVIKKDSFARPHAVKLFNIGTNFYIAIAQDQLHLQPIWTQEYEEPSRFVGCAILKFVRGQENQLRYHQFIKLPYNPLSVGHYLSISHNNNFTTQAARTAENYYLVFSVEPKWREDSPVQAHHFIWSPLDDHFWPFRLPRGSVVEQRPNIKLPVMRFPSQQIPVNLTKPISQPPTHHDLVEPVESCFNQLQRIITDRDIYARKLIQSSGTIWRSPRHHHPRQQHRPPTSGLSNISAQVIVHGNVIVKGQLIESPQISLIGTQPTRNVTQVTGIVASHSPAIVDKKLKQAFYKLNHVRDKLARAVSSDYLPNNIIQMNSRIRFFGTIYANHVHFHNGVANSNVRLNGIPFKQLEHELVNLRGQQDVAAKVVFEGRVFADLLEIHSLVNGVYFIGDAVDITSRNLQVINSVGSLNSPGRVALDFYSVRANELVLDYNSTFNDVVIGDFITRDNRTQFIFGRKIFSKLSMGQLDMGNPSTKLNGFNVNRLATESIRLRTTDGKFRQFMNGHQTFVGHVMANRLIVNNIVNGRINISSLIHDTVKTYDVSPQRITGHKHFIQGLNINRLTTQGLLNGIQVEQIFNLNSEPPVPDFFKYSNNMTRLPDASHPVTGRFIFQKPVTIVGNLNANLVNGLDISNRAVRRFAPNDPQGDRLQIVSGQKRFVHPLQANRIQVIGPQQQAMLANMSVPPPQINGFDFSSIRARLVKLINNPHPITIQNLLIDGNLNLPTSINRALPPKTTFGSFAECPLDLIQRKLILSGAVDQQIDVPLRINSIRSRSTFFDNGAMNGFSFPQDFVLKSGGQQMEPVFGHKTFEHIEFGTAPPHHPIDQLISTGLDPGYSSRPASIVFGPAASINNITYLELQTFIESERKRNFTGEIVYQTINLSGNIRAKRINGYRWPEDILLKSIGSHRGPVMSPYQHRRIYSHLIFLNASQLSVENQLVLRGPIQLNGRLNGINLTEFSRNSVTYGDKDMLAAGRPIRNKVFAGGLTVNDIRSRGLIDGVNIDEMRRRVVTVNSRLHNQQVASQKIFLSDVNFLGPVNVHLLNDLPITHHLKRIQIHPGNQIVVFGKKTITGTLRINGDLIVQGLINKIDFVDLKAKSISISSPSNELQFNKTLIVEGNAFMDNLLIDERNGIIDGVRLASLIPIDTARKNELTINSPHIHRSNTTYGHNLVLEGAVNDCRITCTLARVAPEQYYAGPPQSLVLQSPALRTMQQRSNLPHYPGTDRLISYQGRNISSMRTTPPYATDFTLPPLTRPTQLPKVTRRNVVLPDQRRILYNLARRQPSAIHYEGIIPVKNLVQQVDRKVVLEQLDQLKNQLISTNLIKLRDRLNLVVGFIETSDHDISHLKLPEETSLHTGHTVNLESFQVLDEIDFSFRPTTYHMSVGFFTNRPHNKEAMVFATVGQSQPKKLSELPIESPNNAMFLPDSTGSLFLLVSQDFTTTTSRFGQAQCPRYPVRRSGSVAVTPWSSNVNYDPSYLRGDVHVYLFQVLTNSSLYDNAYFDLYQTIDLPAIDSFTNFRYGGSTYAVAFSRPQNQVYLLLLRGYSGFQVVSHFNAPLVEEVKVFYTLNNEPVLQIYQKNGNRLLMEPVIV